MTGAVAVGAGIALAIGCGGVGCGGRRAEPARVGKDAPVVAVIADAPGERCERQTFAASLPVPEASGAVLLPVDGKLGLVVVSDSGNGGAYVVVDPDSGALRESGVLPLGTGANDDLEGLAVRDGALVGLTSSGDVLVWQRASGRFDLVDGPYRIADPATGLACKRPVVNCGKNYEGLCLVSGPAAPGACVGLAASKADGALYCVTVEGGKLVATARSIPISSPETLTGCDIAPDGSVWAGTNLFGRSLVYRVTGWDHPAGATVEEIGSLGDGFPEAITVGPADGDAVVLYRLSDLGGSPSAAAKYRCRAAER